MTVTGDLRMPLCLLERRMTVIRAKGGRLVVYSALALDETQMRVLEAFGSPSFLIVPNRYHRLDACSWKQRYPELVVVAPSGARAHVEQVVPVDTCEPDFQDEAVRFVEVPGTAGREAALEVRDGQGLTLVLNDIVGNLPRSHGFVLRALGFATDVPRVPRMARRVLVQDVQALRAQFEAWAEQPVERIVVSHGRPILSAAPQALRNMARSL
jgi:hypothetical protein